MQKEEIHYRILKAIEEDPNLSQRELAAKLGVSLGKVNYCLKALIEKGWVKMGNFRRNKNKLRYAYLLTPKGFEEKARVTLAFLKCKQREYDQLVSELQVLRKKADELTAIAESKKA